MRKKALQLVLLLLFSLALISGYLYFLPKTNVLSLPYLKTLDLLFLNRYNYSALPKIIDKLVIVDIDEETLSRFQQRWPINRALYAQFLRFLTTTEAKPSVIVMDIAFTGESELPEPDIEFAQALKDNGSVILGTFLDRGEVVPPEGIFANSAKGIGFVSFPRDVDFSIRRNRPFILGEDKTICSLTINTIAVLMDLANCTYNKEKATLKISSINEPAKSIFMPIDSNTETARINYFAKFSDFKVVPFWRVISSLEPASTFKDKIVLVGTAMELLHDKHPTPLGMMPGIAINANFLLSILLNKYLVEIPIIPFAIILLFCALLISFSTIFFSNTKGFLIAALFSLFSIGAAIFLIRKDIILDCFGISLISILSFAIPSIIRKIYLSIEGARLNKLALTDPLTGLYILAYLQVKLTSEIRSAKTVKSALSLVVFDIDKFQQFNESCGYQCGDAILRNLADLIKKNSRPTDTICRSEGVKIAVILSKTKLDGAGMYAEKIRKIIEGFVFEWQGKQVKFTVSAGVSGLLEPKITTAKEVIDTATEVLKEALTAGNKIKSVKS